MNLLVSRIDETDLQKEPCLQPDLSGQVRHAAICNTPDPNYQSLINVGVHLHSFSGAIQWMNSALRAGPDCGTATVVFLNTHNLNVAWTDPEYRRTLKQVDRVYPDGIGVRIAGLFAGIRYFDNLAGTDLVPSLLKQPELRGRRVFILGDAPNQIERICSSFRRQFPHLQLAGHHHGFFDCAESQAVVELINASQADILLVGMGTPKQEKWLAQHKHGLKPSLRIGVGGLFHYWDGRLRRAPALLRHMKLEWAYILMQQPHRWRRYAWGAPMLLWRAVGHSLAMPTVKR